MTTSFKVEKTPPNCYNINDVTIIIRRIKVTIKNQDYIKNLVIELISLPSETEWVEFKHNNDDPRMINPKTDFRFYKTEINEKNVVLLEIPCAEKEPIKFSGEEYIRIGTNKKKLKEYPNKERALWAAFDTTPFELRNAKNDVPLNEVINLLSASGYYEKMGIVLPQNSNKILDDFINEKFIKRNDAGNYDISNLGALLVAKDLNNFERLAHKELRVIWYKDNNKLNTVREKVFSEGYAISYEKIIDYVLTIIPQEEIIEDSIRQTKLGYPEIAIRELIANIMIHQAIEQRGTSPMVELFKDRIEFSNAGSPLISIDRIVDTVPRYMKYIPFWA